ncbi:MAG: indolepyruvate oxidoreductase subunit beta [Clostridiales bacterium]|nr:indolepyruvate oxidoreductase subunit beta [Clostridiales bacterium]
MTNCLIVGVGGQGTILAARLVGMAAMEAGLSVRGSETIGMAQRGGSVASHVRMGGEIFSPLIPPGEAGVVVAFEPGEAVRAAEYLSPRGIAVVCDRPIQPAAANSASAGAYSAASCMDWLRASAPVLYEADGEKIIARISARCLNVALLGIAIGAGAFPFETKHMEAAIARRVSERYVKMNIDALRRGMALDF